MAKRESERQGTRERTIVRTVATMFLILAVADLAFPQLCRKDSEPLFQASSARAFVTTSGHGEERPAAHQTEDCFCCCSHIESPDPGAPLGALALVSEPPAGAPITIPVAPGPYLFRPPRVA